MILINKYSNNNIYLKLNQKYSLKDDEKYVFEIIDKKNYNHIFFVTDLSLEPVYYNIFNLTISSTTNYSAQTLKLDNIGYYDLNIYYTNINDTIFTNKKFIEKQLVYLNDVNTITYNKPNINLKIKSNTI